MNSINKDMAIEMNIKRWGDIKTRYDWNHIQDLHKSGLTVSKLHKTLGISYSILKKAVSMGLLVVDDNIKTKRVTSEETKRKISDKRKQWLNDNPDKHPWRNKDKFKSEPCEKVKEFLKELNIPFIAEYQPDIEGRAFSIDIALPDKMIALEINGNQHYERDGSLKPYYQERHNLLESNGWNVYEIHYSACFNLDKWTDFIGKLKDADKKVEFDYFAYTPKNVIQNKCVDCSIDIYPQSIRCKSCAGTIPRHRKRKVERPSKDELVALIWKYSFVELGKMFGVSDNAVRKWCKSYDIINYPPTGYWLRSGERNRT